MYNAFKLGYLDPSKAILKGLMYYLPPSEGDFESIRIPEHKRKASSRKKNTKPTYVTSRRTGFKLIADIIDDQDLRDHHEHLVYLEEFYNILQFVVIAYVVNGVAVTFECLKPQAHAAPNLDMGIIFLLLCGTYALCTNLQMLMARGIGKEDVRSTVWAGIVGSLIAYGFLQLPPTVFDFRLELAMPAFTQRWRNITAAMGTPDLLDSKDSISTASFHFILVVLAGIISAAAVFPAMRVAGRYNDMVEDEETGVFKLILLNTCFLAPLFLVMCWIPPLISDFILSSHLKECYKNALIRDCTDFPPSGLFINESMFNAGRLYAVFAYCVLSLFVVKYFLQAQLDLAKSKVLDVLNTVGDLDERVINSVRYSVQQIYLQICIFGVQYVGPIVFTLASSAILYRRGDTDLGVCAPVKNILRSYAGWESVGIPSAVDPNDNILWEKAMEIVSGGSDTILVKEWFAGVSSKAYFDGTIIRPVFGFLVWWSLASTFSLSAIGIIYHRRKALMSDMSQVVKVGDGSEKDDGNTAKIRKHIEKSDWEKEQKKLKKL